MNPIKLTCFAFDRADASLTLLSLEGYVVDLFGIFANILLISSSGFKAVRVFLSLYKSSLESSPFPTEFIFDLIDFIYVNIYL